MEVRFFNHEVENPVLRFLIAIGAAVFAAALAAAVLVLLIPVLGAVLTGVLLIVAVVLILLVVFLPFVAFMGVVFSRGEKGSGVISSEVREVEPFTSLKVSGRAEVSLKQGDRHSVTVFCDDNLIDNVETSVSGDELTVGYSRPVARGSKLKVEVTARELKNLRAYGASKIKLENIETEALSIRASGAAEIESSGCVEEMNLRISGAGKYQGGKLIAQTADVNISGAGDAAVHAERKLKVKISGAGSVQCSGNPETVEKHISGAGKVSLI